MIFFIILISQNFLYAFNEDLSAVHYSVVTPGIDEELKPGIRISKNAFYRVIFTLAHKPSIFDSLRCIQKFEIINSA